MVKCYTANSLRIGIFVALLSHFLVGCINNGTAKWMVNKTNLMFSKDYSPGDTAKIYADGLYAEKRTGEDTSSQWIKFFSDGSCCQTRGWGIYEICQDTITAYLYCLDGGANSWIWQYWGPDKIEFLIMDRSHIKVLHEVAFYDKGSIISYGESSLGRIYDYVGDVLPNTVLKRRDVRQKKWIWRNKEDWKEWNADNRID